MSIKFWYLYMQRQLKETEDYVTKLQKEKVETRAEAEKQAIERNVILEVVSTIIIKSRGMTIIIKPTL